jgi:hypothetical protein
MPEEHENAAEGGGLHCADLEGWIIDLFLPGSGSLPDPFINS